jgi:hypothetical protein
MYNILNYRCLQIERVFCGGLCVLRRATPLLSINGTDPGLPARIRRQKQAIKAL